MTNIKTTKRALFASVLSLALCVSMLIGSTFAWFTDVATTGVNTIQAGEFDVALMMSEDGTEWKNAEGVTLNFKKSADAPAEEEVIWEPGCTYQLPALKIINHGNLAFKYQMFITGMEGDLELAEVLDVWIKMGDGVWNKNVGTLANFMTDVDGAAYGILLPYNKTIAANAPEADVAITKIGETDSCTIALHMQESAGNEYQMQTIRNMAFTVYASQYAYEYDSFDNQYDQDAKDERYYLVVKTAEELTAALANGVDGAVITLGNDINVGTMEINEEKELTLDLAGYHITVGDSVENASDGIRVVKGATLNIMNSAKDYGSTTIEYVGTNTRYDGVFVDENSTLNIQDVNFLLSPSASSAIHASHNSVVNIGEGANINCKGVTQNRFACIMIDWGATVNMTGGTVTLSSDVQNDDTSGWNRDAVGVVIMGNGSTFNMTGGLFEINSYNGDAQGIQASPYNISWKDGNVIVNVSGGEFIVNNHGDIGSACALAVMVTTQGEYNVSGGVFKGNYTSAVAQPYQGTLAELDLDITGGTFAFDPSDYVAEGYSVVENGDGTWTVK